MFDPFNDFETAGYLRNVRKDKDPHKIKRFEHDLFEGNMKAALDFLATRRLISYQDFLAVHKILFSDYYPWAGQDRSVTAPHIAVSKVGDVDVVFEHPQRSRLAVEYGLRLAQTPSVMERKPGEVMGLFAFGHPFLNGNGRTMLLVHMELSHRAGFSIQWERTDKRAYLAALTQEIATPGKGMLDTYLLQFKGPRIERAEWGVSVGGMRGLAGLDNANQVDGELSDPAVAKRYRQIAQTRDYSYAVAESLAKQWNAAPAKHQHSGWIVALSETEVIQDIGSGEHVVWERQKLADSALAVGQRAQIREDGSVTLMVPQKRLGKGMGR
jgi:cell filamentation protein